MRGRASSWPQKSSKSGTILRLPIARPIPKREHPALSCVTGLQPRPCCPPPTFKAAYRGAIERPQAPMGIPSCSRSCCRIGCR
jgi:hypothetical protein